MRWTRQLATAAFAAHHLQHPSYSIFHKKLGPRLSAAYDLVPHTARGVVDVGCDHALLCIALAAGRQHPHLRSVIGVDKAAEPLNVANQNLREHLYLRSETYPLTAHLDLRLGEGLEALCAEDDGQIDTLCMAGIGSGTIVSVLTSLSKYATLKYLVLQPFDSRPQFLKEVRDCVRMQDFLIREERIDFVNGRWFVTIAADKNAGEDDSRQRKQSAILGETLRRRGQEDPQTLQVYGDYLAHHLAWFTAISRAQGGHVDITLSGNHVATFLVAIEQEMAALGV
ncbi:sam-dependent methyltransferase [Nannochloropsis oceanica]